MQNFSFMIVGFGVIAKKHIKCIQDNPSTSLCGISDLDKSKLSVAKAEFNVPTSDKYIDLIKQTKPDVVVICSSSNSHSAIANDIAGMVKLIIIEKPIALNISDAEQIIEKCKQRDTKLSIVKQNRFNKPIKLIKKLLDDKEFGEIFSSSIVMRWTRTQEYYDSASWRGTWKNDGGVLANQGIHFLDALTWLIGDVESVIALSKNALLDIEAEDTIIGLLKFKSGGFGTIEFTTATRPSDLEGSITLLGTKGSCEIGGFAMNSLSYLCTESGLSADSFPDDIENPKVYAYSHKNYYDEVIDSMINNIEPPVSGEEGLLSLKLVHALYSSSENGHEIFLNNTLVSKLRNS